MAVTSCLHVAVAKMRSSDAAARNFDLAQPRPLAFTFHLREGPEDDVGRWGWLLRLLEKQAMIPLAKRTAEACIAASI